METGDRVHTFHAKAWVLDAQLQRPLQTEVRPQAFVKLCEKGGYFSERAEKFRLEGIISFRSAYTQVAGTQSPKPGGGWVTLATSVVEGLNVLDVVTADRVVAQISTEHPRPKGQHVPSVTFLGTRFENLKISGHEIRPKLKLDMCGATDGKQLYLANEGFRKLVTQQHNALSQAASLPESVRAKYRGELPDSAKVQAQWEAFVQNQGPRPGAAIECSLVDPSWKTTTVNSAGQLIEVPAGHVIEIPDFGRIFLAELKVDCDSFDFTMIRLDMGCIGAGSGTAAHLAVNGSTVP